MRNIIKCELGIGLNAPLLSGISLSNLLPNSTSIPEINIPDGSNLHLSTPKFKMTKQLKMNTAGSIIGAIASLGSAFLPEKSEYSGEYGNITKGMDTAYDAVSDMAMMIPGAGMIIGGIMKGADFLNKGLNALGVGTDGMTKQDAVLGSSFLALTPVGLINSIGAKKSDTMLKDEELLELVGSSYGGTYLDIDAALNTAGKKYGTFSRKALRKANENIAILSARQNILQDISDENVDALNRTQAMSAINNNRRALALSGGFQLQLMYRGKQGLKISPIKARRALNISPFINKSELELILPEFEDIIIASEGTKIKEKKKLDPFEEYLQSIPESQRDSTDFRVKDYWEFNGRPKNFEEAIKRGMFVQMEDGWHAHSVQKNPNTGEYEFMKSPDHPTILMEIDWYNSGDPEAIAFRKEYELLKVLPYYKYVKRETPLFKSGGAMNVIPDGALHARKHNMDIDGITKKGIPVVSEDENGKIELLAEIERNELILRIEITNKLEELYKKYYDDNSSKEEKELCTLEAGKLLTEEILYNTDDKTGLINQITNE